MKCISADDYLAKLQFNRQKFWTTCPILLAAILSHVCYFAEVIDSVVLTCSIFLHCAISSVSVVFVKLFC